MNQFYAHSTKSKDKSDWQPLSSHLDNVCLAAGVFAEPFNAQIWAMIIGQNHDLGKGSKQWQAYLRHVNNVVDEFHPFYDGHPSHAFTGAQWLYKRSKIVGKLLAYCIAGHHAGLPNWDDVGRSALKEKMEEQYAEIAIQHQVPDFPEQPPLRLESGRLGFQFQFFIRMLFSCLVDADFLDTEKSLDKKKPIYRSGYPTLSALNHIFWQNFNELRKNADQTPVNQLRELVLADCQKAAKQSPGIFSLTVPTGGGKTLASLSFALEHGKLHDKSRIIYVIPFTSIIEQNAKVFRDILNENAVLEHHCNFFAQENDWRTKLASENWDAPVIVTTNVQFFDSFFANKPSKCRKLHNIANSVIIFDEVQAIPIEKLKPCIEVIKELSLNYNVTSVLCTATQPALRFSNAFESGLKDVREIIYDVPTLFLKLKRTKETFIGRFTEEEVAQKILQQDQVLCIVNTRQQALDIFNALPDSNDNIHLSALMYPAHRSKKLAEIKKRLNSDDRKPCRVISTQLIEAGVDIDFPCVFRKVAGIDSIAQAAGRCNRNGISEAPQQVYIFDLPEKSKCHFFRVAGQSAAKLFEPFYGDLTSPECVIEYFKDYFWKNEQNMDRDNIIETCLMAQSLNIQFKDIAKFKMINSASLPVIVAFEDEAIKWVEALINSEHKGGILRKLQKYCVQIYPYQIGEIEKWLEQPIPGVWVLRTEILYSEKTGLICKEPEGNAFYI
jgi:CRISPR-associated endonuclease/helicase Cas3